jgi:hypothetical protein
MKFGTIFLRPGENRVAGQQSAIGVVFPDVVRRKNTIDADKNAARGNHIGTLGD